MAKDKIKIDPSEVKTRKKVSGYGLLGTKYKKNPKYRDKPRNKRIDIREMNEEIRDLDPFEEALREVEKKFDISLAEGKCGGYENEESCGSENEEEGMFNKQQKSDMNRLWSHYKDEDMDSSELMDAISNDLEMLEYNPDDVEKMTKVLVPTIAKKALKAPPFVD